MVRDGRGILPAQAGVIDNSSRKGAAELRFKFFIWLLAIAAIGIWGLCYAYMLGPFRPELSRARYLDIRASIRAAPSAVIVFGDSIVLGAPLPNAVCGNPVVNAGVGGAGIQYFERYSIELLDSSAPKLIVLAVGINDAHAGTSQMFPTRYQETVTKLAHRAPVLLATLAPVQPGLLARQFDPELVPRLNEVIKGTAGSGVAIDLHASMSEANLTTDGVHLNSRGYELWIKAIVEGIANALGCRP